MDEITVRKSELLNVLRKNREDHRGIFLEAVEGYKKRVIEELQSRLDAAIAGTKYDAHISLSQPEDHTTDYDRAIRMLEMHTADTITVSYQDFVQYVDDEWGWKGRFLASNSAYSSTARATLERNVNAFGG